MIYAIFNSVVSSKTISGGDRISIELLRDFKDLTILCCKSAKDMCQNDRLKARYIVYSKKDVFKDGLIISYIDRIIKMCFRLPKTKKDDVIYSTSDFLTDVIPAYLLKIKNKSKWVAGIYLIAKNPFKKETKFSFRSVLYYLTQTIAIKLMKKSDIILVLNEMDKQYLVNKGIQKDKIKIISGGVNLKDIKKVKATKKIYDGCFIGRFHPQKGIFELIDIWKLVVKKIKNAKLAIIGWGDEKTVKRLKEYSKEIKHNIEFLGFLDGKKKFEVLKSSKVFLFPSNYESWGLVGCEAMAAELPVVAYDLPIFKQIFKKGMVRIPLHDKEKFSSAVIKLLKNTKHYNKIKNDAIEMAKKFDWDELRKNTKNIFI